MGPKGEPRDQQRQRRGRCHHGMSTNQPGGSSSSMLQAMDDVHAMMMRRKIIMRIVIVNLTRTTIYHTSDNQPVVQLLLKTVSILTMM